MTTGLRKCCPIRCEPDEFHAPEAVLATLQEHLVGPDATLPQFDGHGELLPLELFDRVKESEAVFDAIGVTEQAEPDGAIGRRRAARPRPEAIGAKCHKRDGGEGHVVERPARTGKVPVNESVRQPVAVDGVDRA